MSSERPGRLARLSPGQLNAEQSQVYEEITGGPRRSDGSRFQLAAADGSLEGPFNTMLLAPKLGLHLQRLGSAVRYETSLPATARELAILACARSERSEFEWYAHRSIALAAGVSQAVVDQVFSGAEDLELEEPVDATVVTVARLLLDTGDLSDEAYEAALDVLTEQQLVELVVLVGYYRLLSSALRVFRVPLPPGSEAVFETPIS